MSIILRTNKGSALTYDEMDRNQSQFFYSSSLQNNNGTLRLHYTGSVSLDTAEEGYGPGRFHDITLNTGTGSNASTGVIQVLAGPNITVNSTGPNGTGIVTITGSADSGGSPGGTIEGAVQYRVNGTTFGGDDSWYYYNSSTKKLGLNTSSPETAFHIIADRNYRAANIRLQTDGGLTKSDAVTEIYHGSSLLGKIGKAYHGNSKDIYITANYSDPVTRDYNKINFSIGDKNASESSIRKATLSTSGFGINTYSPNLDLTIVTKGSREGIGLGINTTTEQSRIRPINSEITQNLLANLDLRSKSGLLIHTPQSNTLGGNIVLGVHDDDDGTAARQTPNRVVIAAFRANGDEMQENAPIASFLSNQTVGINTHSPNTKVRLDVNGQYRGGYNTMSNTLASIDFVSNSVISATLTDSAHTATLTEVPPAGTKAVLVIYSSLVTNTVTFSSTYFITQGTVATEKTKYSTVSFVSNGTKLIETSRVVSIN